MNLRDLDLKKLQFSPIAPLFIKDIEAMVPGIKQDFQLLGKKAVYTYIVLMYDPGSPLASMKDIDWWTKKYEAGEAAGFRVRNEDGKTYFEKPYDSMFLGKDDDIVKAITAYVAFCHNPVWTEMVYLNEVLIKYTQEALGGRTGDINEIKAVAIINNRLDSLAERVFSLSNETELFRQKLYSRVEEARLMLKPEDYAKRFMAGDKLQEDNPYGEYIVDDLEYEGTEIPS